ncbi:MAG: glycosyltransferase family 2 protein [Hymenobacter sp.]|nr:MAG: glycosyltransferase family 2 protein [Hymenobacter sp.]
MQKVSVIIPVYNQWHLVKRNVDALLLFDKIHIAEIIIVDDCSPEKNVFEFNNELVKVISNEHNKGYAGTVNNGLKKAHSSIVVLLDSDAYPICPFIENLLAMYAADTSLGCIGFQTIDDEGNKTGSYTFEPSLLGLLVGQQLEMRLNIKKSNDVIPYSCSVSFRKACLEDLGYLNEKDFPVLDADFDISMHIHRSKWKLIIADDITVSHSGGHSYKINYKRVLLFHDSRWKLLRNHGQIHFPRFIKMLLKSRIHLELNILRVLSLFSSNTASESYDDKVRGRKILLQHADLYE